MSQALYVEVVLDQGFSRPLDYKAGKDQVLKEGMRVLVPFRKELKQATIIKLKKHSSFSNIRQIEKILEDKNPLSPSQWQLTHWMAEYYCTSVQKVLKCFTPPSVRKNVQEKTQIFLQLKKTHEQVIEEIAYLRRKAPKQAEALEQILNAPKGIFFQELDVSRAAITALVQKGLISIKPMTVSENLLLEEEYFPTTHKKLNDEQQKALESIQVSVQQRTFQAHLLYGVTGSGKTEVYMQAMDQALKLNLSVIVLVPEVSLTSQTIERFKSRFSEKIAILHHKRSLGERTSAFEDLIKGEARIVIGARSALFAPAKNLGLIIVDEEHDSSYKQTDEMPCYHARDTAVMRAYFENCTILLGSATPSIESRYNAEIGKYQLHTLKKRASSAHMPDIQIVDMKQALERQGGFSHFSDTLLTALKKRLECGEQALLFLNKRGYHRMQTCSQCQHVIKCPHCDLALTFHKKSNLLHCHLCDYRKEPLKKCPNCHSDEPISFKGFGTEHVEQSLHAILPQIRTLRMDRDTTGKKNSHEEMFKQFRAHKADVLIGTQMIAKGFHFPSVTLVGVLNTDATLNIPDFRSEEQVFQLITQVAGRAGRAELKGEVIIQTFLPDHRVFKMAKEQDTDLFYHSQIEERKMFHYPPFCRMIKLLFSDKSAEVAEKKGQEAIEMLKGKISKATILPLMPAGHAKVKDQYRYQFFIKTNKIKECLQALPLIQGAKIDVDPLSTFF